MSFLTKFTAEGKREILVGDALAAAQTQFDRHDAGNNLFTDEERAAVNAVVKESVTAAMTPAHQRPDNFMGELAKKQEALYAQLEASSPRKTSAAQAIVGAAEEVVHKALSRIR